MYCVWSSFGSISRGFFGLQANGIDIGILLISMSITTVTRIDSSHCTMSNDSRFLSIELL